MPRRKVLIIVAAVAVVVAVIATVVAVNARGDRDDLADRVSRLEQDRGRSPTTEAEGEEGAEGGEDGSLADLLEGLAGSGDGEELFGSTAIEDCAPIFSAALTEGGVDLGSLFSGGGAAPGTPKLEPAAQIRQIATEVQEVRRLQFKELPDPVLLTPADLARRVASEVDADLKGGAVAAEQRVLIALGALEPGTDLAALTRTALAEQVAGFYDPDTGELVAGRPGSGSSLDGQTQIVLAHELDHALADQVLELPVDDGQPAAGKEDEALAASSLVEGDATLLMQLYGLRHIDLLAQLGDVSGALSAKEDLEKLPHQLQRTLTFPYFDGMSFVCKLYAEGGWKAVDAAYAKPPTTTAQVLFPERYLRSEGAIDPRDPGSPGDGWEALPAMSLGAAQLLWLLEAPGGDADKALDDPRSLVEAWGGGEVRAFSRGGDTALGVALVQRQGGSGLCKTIATWYRAAFPGGTSKAEPREELAVDGAGQDAVVRCTADEVRLGIAPDLATARRLTA